MEGIEALARQFGPIGGLLGLTALLTGWGISGLTLVWPQRPAWAGWALSLILGPLICAGIALGQGLVYTVVMPVPQLVAQIVLIGLAAGLIAAGQNATAVSAERKRNSLPVEAGDQLAFVAGLSERLARLERERAQQRPAHRDLADALSSEPGSFAYSGGYSAYRADPPVESDPSI